MIDGGYIPGERPTGGASLDRKRKIDLPVPARSPYGAFAEGGEATAMLHLREELARRGLTAAALINSFESYVSDDARVQHVLEAIKRFIDGAADPELIPPVVELLYFAGQQEALSNAKLLFPPYSTVDTYARNIGNPVVTQFDSRPSIQGDWWSFLGHRIGFPIGVGASPFTDNSRWIKVLAQNGFNVFTYRTVRSQSRGATPPPNWIPVQEVAGDLLLGKHPREVVGASDEWIRPGSVDFSTANFFGVPSAAPKHWQDDLGEAISFLDDGQLIIASVLGEDYKTVHNEKALIDDFEQTARHALEAGATVLEINLSCPNTLKADGPGQELLCHDWGLSGRIVKSIRDKIGTDAELVVKLGDMSLDNIASIVSEIGRDVDALAGINAIPSRVSGLDNRMTLPVGVGGVSGSSIHAASVEFVTSLSKERFYQDMNYEIVALGGVTSPDTFHNLYNAGASIVQTVSGVFSNPLLAYDCIAALGADLPSSPPEAAGVPADEVSAKVEEVVRANRDADQFTLANEMPLSVAATFDQLDELRRKDRLVAQPPSSAWSVDPVRYRIVR